MSYKHALLLSIFAGAALAISGCSAATDAASSQEAAKKTPAKTETDGPKITTDDLGGGFYRLVGPGGNIGVSIGSDGVFVIDDKYDRFADQIIEQIKAITDQPINYVINTHYHGDHTGGNGALKDVGATVVAHDNVRARMGISFDNKLFGRTTEATAPRQWPTVTFSENATFHFNGQTTQIIHTPAAHTDGDSIVFFKEANILHMGDNYFNPIFPYVDVDSGGTLQGMIKAQTVAINLINATTQVIPGHGNMSNKAELMATRDRLQTIHDRIKARIKAGKTISEIIAEKPLADLAQFSGFIKEDVMVRIAYRSIVER